jgi:mannose-6-phosphate isomerase-like protein (cupin superfamily)
MTTTTAPRVLLADEGEKVNLFDLGVRFLIEGDTTAGAFSLVEHPLPPRALGSPIHTHRNEDEYSFVLEGRVGVLIGDDVVVAGPGTLVFKPRAIPHAFWNSGDDPARLLEMISPAGFENYFREMAPVLDGPEPDYAAAAKVADRYGIDLDFGSVPMLVERFGLRVG